MSGYTPFSAYSVALQNPLPLKEPGSTLTYSENLATALPGPQPVSTDPLVSASLSIAPSGSGEMTASALSISGLTLSFKLAGGVPSRVYTLNFIATSTAGQVFQFPYSLTIDTTLGEPPFPPAPSPAFGTPITWAA